MIASAPTQKPLAFRDMLAIARHEIVCMALVAANLLDRNRQVSEADFARIVQAERRLRALGETR